MVRHMEEEKEEEEGTYLHDGAPRDYLLAALGDVHEVLGGTPLVWPAAKQYN